MNSKQIVEAAVQGIQEKKGKQISVLNLENVNNAICDYFVICHGSSNTNVAALADSVEESVQKNLGEKPVHKEGKQEAEWVLIDYFNVVVHVFQEEARSFYNLEELWADAEIEVIEELD